MSHSYNSLYNYLCLLYSQPTYEDKKDKQKIFRLYNDLFSEQKKSMRLGEIGGERVVTWELPMVFAQFFYKPKTVKN